MTQSGVSVTVPQIPASLDASFVRRPNRHGGAWLSPQSPASQPQRNRANLMHFLKYVQVLDWQMAQSEEAAQLRCELVRKAQPIGPYDTLIAAHARSLHATLVTHNTSEFGRVDGLQVEDWELP